MRTGIEDYFVRSCYAAPDRILVATALTDLEYLAPQAVAQAQAAQAELVFVHAIEAGAPSAQATYYNPLKADRDARLTLEVLARHIRIRNIACSTVVRHGEPAEVLEEVLRERPAGRLLMGAHATSDASGGSLGRTASSLLLQTPVPVCVLPSHVVRQSQTGLGQESIKEPHSILYPVGEHGPHPEGIRFALDLAQYFHAELILLQIAAPGRTAADPLATTCSAGLWPHIRHIRSSEGNADSVLHVLRETEAGMLLVEAPSSTAGSAVDPKSLSDLVALSPCPVLTFPVLPWDRDFLPLNSLSEYRPGLTPLSSLEVH